MKTVHELLSTLPQTGRVEWIGVRPARHAPLTSQQCVEASVETGLQGDRYQNAGKRQVTLIQAEHLPVLSSLVGKSIVPGMLRRNIVVSGLNLAALKVARFRIGNVLLEGTGPCEPCSRMEEVLGPGGYNTMRGHGGITARILEGGSIGVGDAVSFVGLEKQGAPER